LRVLRAGYETTLDNLVEVTFTVSRAFGNRGPQSRQLSAADIIARSSGARPSIFRPIGATAA